MPHPAHPLCQSISRDQVAAVVHHFYQRVLRDELLSPFFAGVADWPRHEGYITDFWWGVMGGAVAEPRAGAMLHSHQGLALTTTALERWLELFNQSIDESITEAEAAQWQAMARGIARMMGAHGLIEE